MGYDFSLICRQDLGTRTRQVIVKIPASKYTPNESLEICRRWASLCSNINPSEVSRPLYNVKWTSSATEYAEDNDGGYADVTFTFIRKSLSTTQPSIIMCSVNDTPEAYFVANAITELGRIVGQENVYSYNLISCTIILKKATGEAPVPPVVYNSIYISYNGNSYLFTYTGTYTWNDMVQSQNFAEFLNTIGYNTYGVWSNGTDGIHGDENPQGRYYLLIPNVTLSTPLVSGYVYYLSRQEHSVEPTYVNATISYGGSSQVLRVVTGTTWSQAILTDSWRTVMSNLGLSQYTVATDSDSGIEFNTSPASSVYFTLSAEILTSLESTVESTIYNFTRGEIISTKTFYISFNNVSYPITYRSDRNTWLYIATHSNPSFESLLTTLNISNKENPSQPVNWDIDIEHSYLTTRQKAYISSDLYYRIRILGVTSMNAQFVENATYNMLAIEGTPLSLTYYFNIRGTYYTCAANATDTWNTIFNSTNWFSMLQSAGMSTYTTEERVSDGIKLTAIASLNYYIIETEDLLTDVPSDTTYTVAYYPSKSLTLRSDFDQDTMEHIWNGNLTASQLLNDVDFAYALLLWDCTTPITWNYTKGYAESDQDASPNNTKLYIPALTSPSQVIADDAIITVYQRSNTISLTFVESQSAVSDSGDYQVGVQWSAVEVSPEFSIFLENLSLNEPVSGWNFLDGYLVSDNPCVDGSNFYLVSHDVTSSSQAFNANTTLSFEIEDRT